MPTLAQAIKAKYPQYANTPDAQLEQKILAKYPQYAGKFEQTQEQPSLGGFLGNVVKSGANLVGNTLGAAANVFNPNLEQNTLVNLGKAAVGTAQLLDPTQVLGTQYEDIPRNIGSYYAKRYGQDLGKTLYEDPVGALADVASVAGGGSALLKGAGKAAELVGAAGTASKLAGAAGKLGSFASTIDPLTIGTKIVGRGVEKVAEALSNKTKNLREGVAGELAIKSMKLNKTQLENIRNATERFDSATGKTITTDPAKYLVEQGIYDLKDVQSKIDPLQKQFNKLARTDEVIDPAIYAQKLREDALALLDKERSAGARATAEKLWKEADIQESLGAMTKRQLADTVSGDFSRTPKGAMIDPESLQFNKYTGISGIKARELVAPGTGTLGQKLEPLKAVEKAIKSQAPVGRGSQLFNMLKPSAAGFMAGAASGSFLPGVGNVAGGLLGAGAAMAANNPRLQSAIARGLTQGVALPSRITKPLSAISKVASAGGRAGRMLSPALPLPQQNRPTLAPFVPSGGQQMTHPPTPQPTPQPPKVKKPTVSTAELIKAAQWKPTTYKTPKLSTSAAFGKSKSVSRGAFY